MLKKTLRDTTDSIIESNLDYLVRFAYYRLGNRHEAEDVVYDAILKFLEKDTDKIKPQSVRLYFFRIVHNLCNDKTRHREKVPVPLDDLEIEDSNDEIPDQEDADRINECLGHLPPRESDVIRMNVVDSLSFVEISRILAIPQSTAKSRFKSGMDKLRKLFINNRKSQHG